MTDDWTCPKCAAVNKVDLGNLTDQTARDVEAVKCYNCGHIDWLCDEAKVYDRFIDDAIDRRHEAMMEDLPMRGADETLENAFVEDGQAPCSYCKGSGIASMPGQGKNEDEDEDEERTE